MDHFGGKILIFYIYTHTYNIYPNNYNNIYPNILEQSLVGRDSRENKREENGTSIVTYLIVLRHRDGAL